MLTNETDTFYADNQAENITPEETSFTHKVIVKFNETVENIESTIDLLLSTDNYVIDYIASALDGVVSLFLNDAEAASLQSTLEKSELVDAVQQDYALNVSTVPEEAHSAISVDDEHAGEQWALETVNAQQAWELSANASEVIVAVLDTGIDYNHEDLNGVIWSNTGEIAGNGIDDDGNGYVDDVHGWDFYNGDNDASDDNGHGTAVSSVIAAESNNGVGIAGLAQNVKIMPLKFIGENGAGWFSDAVAAIDYAVANGATVSNNSWAGVVHDNDLLDAILNTQAHNHVFVAAAGNMAQNIDIDPAFPAGFESDNIISVGATGKTNELSFFSNYGENSVDIAAPGSGILSAKSGGGYYPLSGTSLAAPYVTAVVAMLQGLHPDWSYQQIIQAVLDGADSTEALDGLVYNGGLLNAGQALALSMEQTALPPEAEEESPAPVDPSPAIEAPAIPEDAIIGDSDSEKLNGTKNDDYILGNDGDDTLNGKKGDDTLDGGAGDDKLKGGKGDDLLLGLEGEDLLIGGAGNDELRGADANDELRGGADDDSLQGGSGNDTLKGGSGNDVLEDDNGADMMQGGSGDDILVDHDAAGVVNEMQGGTGNDHLIAVANENGGTFIMDGGQGEDTFHFGTTTSDLSSTQFLVEDFKSGVDILNFSGLETVNMETNILQNFNGTIQNSDGDTILGYYFENNQTIISGKTEHSTEITVILEGTHNLSEDDIIIGGTDYTALSEWI